MKKWLLGLLLLLPSMAIADDVDLGWISPELRENNKPYLVEERGGFKIYDSFDNSGLDIPDGSATAYTITDVPVGIHSYTITTYDTEGRESVWSSEVIIEIFEEVIYPPKSPSLTAVVQKKVY